MKLFGLTILRTKAASDAVPISPRGGNRGILGVIRESFTGAWQRNVEVRTTEILAFGAVYACIQRIAQDVGKLRIKLVEWVSDDRIWREIESASFSPVLKKPNRWQNRIKFLEQWIISKLVHGNTYVLKERDARGVVVALYVLDPVLVTVLVTPGGDVYYQLRRDDLAGVNSADGRLPEGVVVPASEIIHDVGIALFHPLVGVSPLYACGLSAAQGLRIQNNSANFFANGQNPGGILSAPGNISDETARRLKEHWEQNYSGSNVGKVAVLGDNLKFEKMAVTAVDAQLIEQLRWTANDVCGCFAVPPYMVNAGPPPSYNNIEALAQQYYSQCLQSHIESIELCLDEGLGLNTPKAGGEVYGAELDLDGLLRMDTSTLYKTIKEGINGGFLAPNEGRQKLDLPPVAGGDTPYMQQQNYSLAALDERDSQNPLGAPAPQQPLLLPPPSDDGEDGEPVDDEGADESGDDSEKAANVLAERVLTLAREFA